MFDRFIRLARAKKALREQRYLDALQQASDPVIEQDRRAEQVRELATEHLVEKARARLVAGDASVAAAELKRLRQLTDAEAVARLEDEVQRAVAANEQRTGDLRTVRAEFRRLVEAGELLAAEDLLATWPGGPADRQSMTEHLTSRRQQAKDALDRAVGQLGSGSVVTAIDGVLRARNLDTGLPTAAWAAAIRQLAEAVAREIEGDAQLSRASTEQLAAALSLWSDRTGAVPELRQQRALISVHSRLGDAVLSALRSVDDLAVASRLAKAVVASDLELANGLDAVVASLAALATGDRLADDADAAAVARLQEQASAAGLRKIAKLAGKRVAETAAGEQQLVAARELLEQGQLEAARAMFVAFAAAHPLHEGVQKELDLLDASMADLDRRLADLRLTLRSGKLRQACTAAMALVGTARIASEAQQILAEARSRIALVDRGLDEVRVSLHGRAAATLEGVRHCLKRLEELAKVQSDHEQLPSVIASVQAEIAALEGCEAASAALQRGDIEAVASALPDLVAARGTLLADERIDARLCQLGDGIARCGERALEEGRLVRMQRCGSALRQLAVVRGDFADRAEQWRQQHGQREQDVSRLLHEAREQLATRDLAAAEQLHDEARQLWCESGEVQAFGHQLAKLRKQTRTLEQVAAMTSEKDLLGAQQKLASMPGVSPMLRTRVYDLKQDLARAQGLDGAFLLRVDEGGEHLVMRGESVSIGNVRQGSADLPVLANLAGRHASVRRSMSFHGGMEDAIVAEDGDVRVAGRKVDRQVLNSGDRVQLGPALHVLYDRPSQRSLTSRLMLQNGFQVAGTDRLLLMKDRGRDGRILLGPGRDAHVTVPKATGELEVFANNSGQMRVFCEQGGTIDGASFRGEHPVAAGQIVEAAGITFLLLPWQPVA